MQRQLGSLTTGVGSAARGVGSGSELLTSFDEAMSSDRVDSLEAKKRQCLHLT